MSTNPIQTSGAAVNTSKIQPNDGNRPLSRPQQNHQRPEGRVPKRTVAHSKPFLTQNASTTVRPRQQIVSSEIVTPSTSYLHAIGRVENVSTLTYKLKQILAKESPNARAISRAPMSASELINNKELNKQLKALANQLPIIEAEHHKKSEFGISPRSIAHSPSVSLHQNEGQFDIQLGNLPQSQLSPQNPQVTKQHKKERPSDPKYDQPAQHYETSARSPKPNKPSQKNNILKRFLVILIFKLQKVANNL